MKKAAQRQTEITQTEVRLRENSHPCRKAMAWECRFHFLNIWSDRDGEQADEGEDRKSSETEQEFVSVGASERPDDESVLGKSDCVLGVYSGIFVFPFHSTSFYRFS